jgi:hypothetical protein
MIALFTEWAPIGFTENIIIGFVLLVVVKKSYDYFAAKGTGTMANAFSVSDNGELVLANTGMMRGSGGRRLELEPVPLNSKRELGSEVKIALTNHKLLELLDSMQQHLDATISNAMSFMQEHSQQAAYQMQSDFVRLLHRCNERLAQDRLHKHYTWVSFFAEKRLALEIAEQALTLKSALPAEWSEVLRPHIRGVAKSFKEYLCLREQELVFYCSKVDQDKNEARKRKPRSTRGLIDLQ